MEVPTRVKICKNRVLTNILDDFWPEKLSRLQSWGNWINLSKKKKKLCIKIFLTFFKCIWDGKILLYSTWELSPWLQSCAVASGHGAAAAALVPIPGRGLSLSTPAGQERGQETSLGRRQANKETIRKINCWYILTEQNYTCFSEPRCKDCLLLEMPH